MIYKKITRSLLGLVLFLLTLQTALAVGIKTTLDRNPVSLDESVQLIFTATQSPDNDPDFSPLEQDFDILNQSQSSNSSWINGKSSKSIQWTLNIMPKRIGNLRIPTISFGSDRSQSALLRVTQGNTVSNNDNADLFIKVEATPKNPYVQSQVLYTLRLYSRVDLSQARLSELEMQDALIEKLGDVKKYNTTVNGVEYTVNELNYAVFPQKSGAMIINPMVLTAEVVTSNRSRFNGFFSRQMTKTKRVKSNSISLNVQAVPDHFQGKRWIPASHVVIEEKWSGDTEKMKVGEPLTRTLTLLAIGNTVSQLPELHIDTKITQLKTYPDQPVLKEQKRVEGLVAFREEKIAYIPSKAGGYTIPAIEIPWFNTESQSMEVARIAERTVSAIGASSIPQNDVFNEPPKQTNVIEPSATDSNAAVVTVVEDRLWMWISIALAVGWVMTLLYIFIIRQPKQQEVQVNVKEIKLKETVKALKKACHDNNSLACKDALLAWGKIKFNCRNLSDIASNSEARLRDEIHLLNKSLYANKVDAWQGKNLFQAFTENKAREKIAKKGDEALEPLYKV